MGGRGPAQGKGSDLTPTGKLDGLRVVSFESRRAPEMAELIRRHGGEPVSAPSMREIPLAENAASRELLRRLEAGELEMVIFLTGVGMRAVARALEPDVTPERLSRALAAVVTVARGPKPSAALRELGVTATIAVPEPNTWRELLQAIDARFQIHGWNVAVQEYGEENPDLLAGLAERGAQVMRVPVYRWALPEDTGPLRDAVARIRRGDIDVALFTSATQVDHLFGIAADEDAGDLVRELSRIAIGSIGPICTRALERHGVSADFEPEHPKMGHLVLAAGERAPAILATKSR